MAVKKEKDMLHEVLRKMFEIVGEEYTEEYTAQKNWYHLHEWTPEQEKDFKAWLVKYLKKNRIRRVEFEADNFLLCFGWKTKTD